MNSISTRVDASPTKEFFIYMITRDIELDPAIVELIDNSIDGARKLKEDKNYKGLNIKISMDSEKFVIKDNCGGIDLKTAQEYAFKFGRSSDREEAEGYFTGIFGIGMKRALFKIGKVFKVISKTKTESFEVSVDVEEWLKEEEWTFECVTEKPDKDNQDVGTTIIVENLNEDAAAKFKDEYFVNSLIDYIQKYRTVEAECGLEIEVNGHIINYGTETLLDSNEIKPYEDKVEDEQGNITIVAGITRKGQPQKAGWYIYCNGRLVVYADKTSMTGWGDGARMYHPSLAEFRGYVYFESKNLLYLPWNTTKTGVDTSNRLYTIAKGIMIEAMTQVFKTIDGIKNKYDVSDLGDIEFVAKASEKELTHNIVMNVTEKSDFSIIEPQYVEPLSRISFQKPTKEVEKVKEVMGEATNRAVGERLFDYYCEMEDV